MRASEIEVVALLPVGANTGGSVSENLCGVHVKSLSVLSLRGCEVPRTVALPGRVKSFVVIVTVDLLE